MALLGWPSAKQFSFKFFKQESFAGIACIHQYTLSIELEEARAFPAIAGALRSS